MSEQDDEISALRLEVSRLAAIVDRLQHGAINPDDARQFVLLAKKTTSKQWTEQAVSGGAIVDVPAGGRPRAATSDSAPSALIARGSTVVLLELRDQTGMRYVEVGGNIPAPTAAYQVLTTYNGVDWIAGRVRCWSGTP